MNNIIEINKPFTILSRVLLPKSEYEGTEMFPKIEFNFYCNHCHNLIYVEIEPFKTGIALTNLYAQNSFIEKSELLRNGVAKLAKSWQSHLGDLVLFNIPALYLGLRCMTCKKKYLLVFGCGEVQPGRMLCQISGIWEINTNPT